MKLQGGILEAARMLAGLSREARKKALEFISKKDPRMAEELEKNMYTFEDIRFLTPLMLIELLKDLKVSDLGLALRISSNELKDFILKNTPKIMRQEIQDSLIGPPQLASKIEEAQARVMSVVRAKIDKGELIIDKDPSNRTV
jgi:flagellar motor switch protein FliG